MLTFIVGILFGAVAGFGCFALVDWVKRIEISSRNLERKLEDRTNRILRLESMWRETKVFRAAGE